MMRFGRVPTRSRWFRTWIALAAIGLVAATALWTLPRQGSSSPSPSSDAPGGPSSTASSSAVPSPSGDAAAWQPVALEPYVPIADLVAVRSDTAGVEPATAFRLTSRGATPASQLTARLEVSPAIALKVSPGSSAAEAIVQPSAPLEPGTSYRFRIRTDAGAVAASWSFHAKQPLHVVTTIPRDQATGVPTRTGIEVTFDQDDVVGYTGKVTISPAVPFELELDGRTLAVVPAKELAERTVYTVTIARGIGVHGSDVTLERDAVIRFETAARETSAEAGVGLRGPFAEASPAEAPVLGVSATCEQDGGTLDQAVVVYRLPTFDAAVSAARTLLAAPSWATWSDDGLVSTSGLPAVLRLTAHVSLSCAAQEGQFIAFPKPLATGAYLVVMPRPGRDAQLLLQVSGLALYTSVSQTRSVAWVNDVVTGRPVEGASVSIEGTALGRTDANGLLFVTTPRALATRADTAPTPIAVVRRGDAATLGPLERAGWVYGASESGDAYWLAFETDRRAFRTNDTIHAWGMIRPRAGGAAAGVEVRLFAGSATLTTSAPPIARAPATPDRDGMFAASLPIAGLPFGEYQVALVADGEVVTSRWIEVDEIRKPAYKIDVTLDRHVLVDGDAFTATARAAYFDGTPVPGLDLSFAYSTAAPVTATTDATGSAAVRLKARIDGDGTYATYEDVQVTPVHPEEGTISGRVDCRVYPAAVWPTSTATAKDGTVVVDGRLQALDLAALERAFGSGSAAEGGAAISGRGVVVTVWQVVQHQTQTGTVYDWIAKRAVPTYESWTEKRTITSLSRTTDADGRVSVSVAMPDPHGQYQVGLTAKDAAGRTGTASAWVDAGLTRAPMTWPNLASADDPGECCRTYAVGERISLAVSDPVGAQAAGADRYLFTVGQRGIREAFVRTSGTLDRPFAATDVPNVSIGAVEFTGRGYVGVGGYSATVRLATETIAIALSTDAASYRPGSDARLNIRTTGPDGRPTSASVIVQAVDEKLYASGAAYPIDLPETVYVSVWDGVVWRGATHAPGPGPYDSMGGGDTTGGGGGPRADFRDTLLFRRVTTDANGRASVSFKVSDDLTGWRVTVGAVDARLHVGTAEVQVPVGLPFFVEATTAPEYLVSDRPVLRLRAYGSSLRSGQAVSFSVSAPTLGLAATTVAGTAFKSTTLALPRLTAGIHRIEVTGKTVGATPTLGDSLVRTVRVVASRYQELTTESAPLDAAFRLAGGDGLTTYVITDAGRATLAAILEQLLWADGVRVDQALGAAVARDLLVERFGRDPATLPETRFESAVYAAEGGVALLPYSSADPTLTTRVALAAPDRFGRVFLEATLRGSYGDPHSTMTREQGLVALAGLAALGEPVGGELALFASQPSLTARERLYLGIAYAELGDDAAARSIERSLLAEYGRSLGPLVRLDVSPSRDEVLDATGLLAILAAAIGDRVADRAQAYVEATSPTRTLLTLEELAFVRHSLERLDPQPASFAWTLDGTRHVVDLASTGSFTLTLAGSQREALRLERVAGDVTVTSSWLTAARPGSRPSDPDVGIVRTVSPGLAVGQDEMVRVKLTVTFAATATDGCYEITERVPSGLAPLPAPDQLAFGSGDRSKVVITPTAVAGQLVSFCASFVKPTIEAVYSARVVSPGTYTWEPATIAASAGGERASLTEASTLTIK